MGEELKSDPDVENLIQLVGEGYKVFSSHRLESDFASRCSPLADRPSLAARLQKVKSLSETSEEDMAVYMFKAIYTMGNEEDLLYFLPRCLELAAKGLFEPDSEWYSHETLLIKKIKMLKDKNILSKREAEFIDRFFGLLWLVIVSIYPSRKWPPLDFLDEIKQISSQESYLDGWLSSSNPGAIKHLINYATNELCYVKDPKLNTWLQSEPVLEKIVPNI